MKRVRYLAGAAGLAPMALGAVAAGGAHATAGEAAGHAKAVALHATLEHRAIPDINRVNCGYRTDWLRIWRSHSFWESCYANAGSMHVLLYAFDKLDTGNNGVLIELVKSGTYRRCSQPLKNHYLTASDCGVPRDQAAITFLSIFPGR